MSPESLSTACTPAALFKSEKVSITVSCCVLRYDFRVQKKMQDEKTVKIRISRDNGCETLTFAIIPTTRSLFLVR